MLRLLGSPDPARPLPSVEPPEPGSADALRALVPGAIRGDRVIERTLLMAVGPAVLGVARRVLGAESAEVDDVCQEASVGLLSALPAFRGECTVLHFACRVALLTALAARRRRSRPAQAASDVSEECVEFADAALSPAEALDSTRRRQALRGLLDELPLPQAEVLALHVVLGHTVEETAKMMGTPIDTVRSRLRRGLE